MSYLVEQPPHCDLLRLSLLTRRFVRFRRTHLAGRRPAAGTQQGLSPFSCGNWERGPFFLGQRILDAIPSRSKGPKARDPPQKKPPKCWRLSSVLVWRRTLDAIPSRSHLWFSGGVGLRGWEEKARSPPHGHGLDAIPSSTQLGSLSLSAQSLANRLGVQAATSPYRLRARPGLALTLFPQAAAMPFSQLQAAVMLLPKSCCLS